MSDRLDEIFGATEEVVEETVEEVPTTTPDEEEVKEPTLPASFQLLINQPMEELTNQVMNMLDELPAESVKLIAERASLRLNVSPKVSKIIGLVEKLSDEDKKQFFINIKHSLNGKPKQSGACQGKSGFK